MRDLLLHAVTLPTATPLSTVDVLESTDLPGLARTTTQALRLEADRMERDGLAPGIAYAPNYIDAYRELASRIEAV